ncbi:MAG: amidohydrolase family protein [Chthonomonadales bacterium]|nr:amidohydrolase family protein [Chthonomonadales bacterium]
MSHDAEGPHPGRLRLPPGSPPVSDIASFCSHEHWGSIASIGMAAEGFRADTEAGALPFRRTGLRDLLLDPYLGGWAAAARPPGSGPPADDAPLTAVLADLAPHRLTGAFRCLRRGIAALHGHDIIAADAGALERLDAAIAMRYDRLFDWHRHAMAVARLAHPVRPVHPEYYLRRPSEAPADDEARLIHTVMRVDGLMSFWQPASPRREALARAVGVDPADAPSWSEFVGRLLELAARGGAVGIKQLQAYTRPLAFEPRDDSAIRWRGDLDGTEARAFEDWVMHACCRHAHDRGWPHQVHVGTHNLAQSSPLPLAALARRYPRMKIVLLHCWPFLSEAGWLAKHHANVHLDTCWQAVLNPAFLGDALRQWLGYVPLHKVTCGHDATSIEMAAGSALFTREAVAAAVSGGALGCARDDAGRAATALLHDNAARLYGVGEPASA